MSTSENTSQVVMSKKDKRKARQAARKAGKPTAGECFSESSPNIPQEVSHPDVSRAYVIATQRAANSIIEARKQRIQHKVAMLFLTQVNGDNSTKNKTKKERQEAKARRVQSIVSRDSTCFKQSPLRHEIKIFTDSSLSETCCGTDSSSEEEEGCENRPGSNRPARSTQSGGEPDERNIESGGLEVGIEALSLDFSF